MSHSSFLRRFAAADGAPPTAQHLYKAFVLLGSDFGYEEAVEGALEYLADFTRRWGKPSPDNLLAIARRFAPGQPRPIPEPEMEEGEDDSAPIHDIDLAGPDTTEETDTLFALATLGVMRKSAASSALLPYLTSQYTEERWQAAFALVALHDERVFPAVEQMLVEFIGPNQPASPDSPVGYHIQILRSYLPQVLADWGDPRLAPLMRAALLATVRAEESVLQEPHGPDEAYEFRGQRFVSKEAWEWFHFERHEWVEEEHRLVYALGRLGAFGALAGVPTRPGVYYYWGGPPTVYRLLDEAGEIEVVDEVESSYLRVSESRADVFQSNTWRVQACCGFLEPQLRDRLEGAHRFADAPELTAAVDWLLQTQFGLSEVERHQAMEDYERADHLAGIQFYHKELAERAKEDAEE